MLKIPIGRNRAEFYDGALKEMPMSRYMDHQRYVMLDSGVGGDLQAFDNHWVNLNRLYKKGEPKLIEKQIQNLRLCYQMVMERTSPKMMSFVTLLYKWNGKTVKIRTDEDVNEWIRVIQHDLTLGKLEKNLNSIKKKLSSNLRTIFRRFLIQRNQDSTTRI